MIFKYFQQGGCKSPRLLVPVASSLPACMIRIYECVWATLLRPIWRVLNLYRFPFPGLCSPSLELRHAAMQPPPSLPRNTISLINGSPPQNAVVKKRGQTHDPRPDARTPRRASWYKRSNIESVQFFFNYYFFFPVTPPFLRWRQIRRLKVHRRLTSPSPLCIPHPHCSVPRSPL